MYRGGTVYTYTQVYIYIYIPIGRKRERERERARLQYSPITSCWSVVEVYGIAVVC